MSFLGWMALGGLVLLVVALSSAYLRNLPISTSAIYLALGVAIGPLGFGWLRIDLREAGPWFERLTEVALIVALFVGGLKLRLPLRHPAWVATYRLAGPVILASILGVALCAHLLLGLDPAMALLAGAVLAPTDPVLASMVKVDSATGHDRVRYGLSGEAGLNDGAAFPFVVLALLWAEHGGPGGWIGEWVLGRVVWAVPAGLLLGFGLGRAVGATSHLAPQPAAGHRRAERLPGARPHRALLCRRRNHRRMGIPGDLRRRRRRAPRRAARDAGDAASQAGTEPGAASKGSRDRGLVTSAGGGPGRRERRGGGAARAGSRRGRAGGGDDLVR